MARHRRCSYIDRRIQNETLRQRSRFGRDAAANEGELWLRVRSDPPNSKWDPAQQYTLPRSGLTLLSSAKVKCARRGMDPNFKEAIMRKLIVAIVASLLLAGQLLAQTGQDSWDNLKALGVGEKIQVVDQRLKSFFGTFVAVTEEAISFQVGQDSLTVQRPEVLRVTSRERTRRGRNALIGLGIGAAAGAAFGVIMAANDPETTEREYPLAAVGGAVLFGGVGAGVGAAFPSYATIYRSARRKGQSKP